VRIARGDRVRAQAPESSARKSTTRKTWGDGLEKIMETAFEVDRHHALLAVVPRRPDFGYKRGGTSFPVAGATHLHFSGIESSPWLSVPPLD
jgi:hypothetical protein